MESSQEMGRTPGQHGFEGPGSMPRAERRSGADLAALRQRGDAVAGSKCQRLDGHRGLATAGGHQAATIAKKEILDVMSAVIGIDDGSLRIVPHAAGSEKVDGELRFTNGLGPLLLHASCVQQLAPPLVLPTPQLQIVRMILIGHAKCGQAPSVFQFRIERKTIVFDRQRSAVSKNLHGSIEIVRKNCLEVLAPARGPRGETAKRKSNGCEIVARIKTAAAVESDFLGIKLIEI